MTLYGVRLNVVKYDDKCQCKKLTVAETNATNPIQKQHETVDENSMPLPHVPLDTVIDSTNLKAHVIHLFPDLFDGV